MTDLLTTAQVAEKTGWTIWKIIKMVQSGELPYVVEGSKGHSYLFDPGVVDKLPHKFIAPDGLVTQTELSKLTGYCRDYIRMLTREGTIQPVEIDGHTLYRRDCLQPKPTQHASGPKAQPVRSAPKPPYLPHLCKTCAMRHSGVNLCLRWHEYVSVEQGCNSYLEDAYRTQKAARRRLGDGDLQK